MVDDRLQEHDMQEKPFRTKRQGEEQKGIAITLVSVLVIVVAKRTFAGASGVSI
jgi:hypothetical protein